MRNFLTLKQDALPLLGQRLIAFQPILVFTFYSELRRKPNEDKFSRKK
jgi:hypothetical protein